MRAALYAARIQTGEWKMRTDFWTVLAFALFVVYLIAVGSVALGPTEWWI